MHGRPFSLSLTLPPLGALVLKPLPPAPPPDTDKSGNKVLEDSVEARAGGDDVAMTDLAE